MIESIHFQGVDYTPEDFATFAAAHPEAFLPPPPPVPTLEEAKAQKLQEIAWARLQAEIGGVTVAGATIRTDRESQAMITGAALKAIQNTDYSCTWKGESGWVTLTAQQILGIADAVRAHVQTQFDREKTLSEQVQAATTAEAVAAVNW